MKIIYLDTETTGVRDAEICQLSYIIEDDVTLFAKNFFFLVSAMNPFAEAVHGFSIEALMELSHGKRFIDYIDEIHSDMSDADLIIAHNATFDIGMMRLEYVRCEKDFFVCPYLCTMRFMAPYTKLIKHGGGYKYPSLTELADCYIEGQGMVDDYLMQLFNVRAGYHDARYDTVALYLSVYYARRDIPQLKEKLCNSA